MLSIDIIDGCNFKCFFCPAKTVETFQYMPLELFKKIVIEASQLGITDISIVPSRGEPFLHPDIYEMLEFANSHFSYIELYTNASAINVSKLATLTINNVDLNVSYYGETTEKFKELTGMDKNLFDIVHRKLEQMATLGIRHKIGRRDKDWEFDCPETSRDIKFNPNVKCKFHTGPKVLPNGDVVFCRFVRDNAPWVDKLAIANLNTVSLCDALEDPIRYKFFESQSICEKSGCSSFDNECHKVTIVGFKLLNKSKKNYLENKTAVDSQYQELENEVIQRTKQ
jgi:hypothetical protein